MVLEFDQQTSRILERSRPSRTASRVGELNGACLKQSENPITLPFSLPNVPWYLQDSQFKVITQLSLSHKCLLAQCEGEAWGHIFEPAFSEELEEREACYICIFYFLFPLRDLAILYQLTSIRSFNSKVQLNINWRITLQQMLKKRNAMLRTEFIKLEIVICNSCRFRSPQ